MDKRQVDKDYERIFREDWMTDDQWECALLLSDLKGGFHHIFAKIKPFGYGIECNMYNPQLATFDFNHLTKAVVMAHDRMIRFAVGPSGPGRVRLICHKRETREGQMSRRHPTLEDNVAAIRKQLASRS